MNVILILIGIGVLVLFWVIGLYNSLVRNRNETKNAFSQIDVQLLRRYELIPNLVETAKGYMKHEQDTLEKVITARNQAYQQVKALQKNPGDAKGMSELGATENQLSSLLGSIRVTMEAYPELKSNTTMVTLMEELASTENKIAFSRQAYNDSVMSYNTSIETFPSSLIAGSFGFKEASLFELEDPIARKSVKVQF